MRINVAHLIFGAVMVVAGECHSGSFIRKFEERIVQKIGWLRKHRELQTDEKAEASAQSWLDSANPPFSDDEESQALALATLYYATNGVSWTTSLNWLTYSTSICQWYNQKDVDDVCSNGTQTLLELKLTGNNLDGFLPTALGTLTDLEELDLDDNAIGGTLPTTLALMASLGELSLGANRLVGPVPKQFGRMTDLESLYLDENGLTGTLPFELGSMVSLEDLDLSENELEGPLPIELLYLTELESLSVYDNSLNGTVPMVLYTMPNLEELDLGSNFFEGTIPTSVGLSTTLQYLSLKDNYFYGNIPSQIFNIATLLELRLDDNKLTGTIPSNIPINNRMIELQIDGNLIIGAIPTQIGNLLALEKLILANNALTGPVPMEFTRLVNLTSLDLNMTRLTGTIPPGLCTIPDLVFQCKPGIGLCGCDCSCTIGVPVTQAPVSVTPGPAQAPVSVTPPPISHNLEVSWTFSPDSTVDASRNEPPPQNTFCFSRDMTVTVQGRIEPVTMENLRTGDMILTGTGEYSKVYTFGHNNPHKYADFVQVWTDCSKSALEMTGDHLVFLYGKSNPVRASSIQVGDKLLGEAGPATITRLDFVSKYGIYAPLTQEGTLVVAGIVASSYVSFQSMEVEFWGTFPLSHHTFLHILAAPFRLICSEVYSGVCSSVNDDGMPKILAWSIDAMEWILTHQSKIVRWMGFILLVAVTGLFAVIETLLRVFSGASLEMSLVTLAALKMGASQYKKQYVA
jgi:Leucine-rich repeat (LRR) protein